MGKGDQNDSLRLGIGVGDEIESCEDGRWYKAKVISIQKPGLEVTIHYKGWNSKWDKQIKLTSPSVRFIKKEVKAEKHSFTKGQKVMALFTDNNKYAAEIIDIHPDLKYSVKFYDGIVKKNMPESSLDKFTEKASREAQLKAEELYGVNTNKTESPILDRSERRRSNSRPRSETDSTRSGRSTPEPRIIGRRSRSTTPVPPKSAKSAIKTPAQSQLVSSKAKEEVKVAEEISNSAKRKEASTKRKSGRLGPLKRNATPAPELTITPKAIKQNQEPESIEKTSNSTEIETPSRPSRGRPSRTLKIPTVTTPKTTEKKKEAKETSKTPSRGQSGGLVNSKLDQSKTNEITFDFEDTPTDTVQIKENENKDLSSLVGPSGIDKWVEVRYLDDWVTAKIIEPTTPKARNQKPKEGSIYVHYKGWNKSFDSWVTVVPENVRVPKEIEKETKLEWKIGMKLLGKWQTNQHYPCEVIGHSGLCYQVLFYDGFKKRLPPSELKQGTEEEFKNALRLAEIEFGDKSDVVTKPKQRKSIFKRSAEDEEPSDEKLTFLGKKRKRPNSISSTSNPSSPMSSPKPNSGITKEQKPEKIQLESKRLKLTRTPIIHKSEDKQKKQTPSRKNPPKVVAQVSNTDAQQETRLTRRSMKSPQVEKVESKITRRTRQNSIKEPDQTDTVELASTEVLSVQLTPTIVEVDKDKSSKKDKTPIDPGEDGMTDNSSEDKIATPKKIEELTSEEMHRRERELEEAKRRIELESEKIRNEREKRHEARQKAIVSLENPHLQNACRKAIEFLKDDEADLILSQMLPGYIGFKKDQTEDNKNDSKKDSDKPKVESSEKLESPATSESSTVEKMRPKRGRPRLQVSTSEPAPTPVTQSQKNLPSLVALETGKLSTSENQVINKSDRRRTRSKKMEPEPDNIEILSVETVIEEKPDSVRVTRKRTATNSDSSVHVKNDDEVIIITDPKPDKKTERPKRTRTSSAKADVQINLTSVPPKLSTPVQQIAKKDENQKTPSSPRVTITNPPNVDKMIRDEIKKQSPTNSPKLEDSNQEDSHEGVKSPRSTRSTRITSQNNQSSNPEQLEETAKYKMGDLVWVKWSDTRPYGALIVGHMENDEGYKLRFALDGVEKEFKLERITGKWNPVEHLTDDFGNYFDTMYRNSDAKEVRLGLIAAKVAFENEVKAFKSSQKASLKSDSKSNNSKSKSETKIGPTKSDLKSKPESKSIKPEIKPKQLEVKVPDSKIIPKTADQPVRKSSRISSPSILTSPKLSESSSIEDQVIGGKTDEGVKPKTKSKKISLNDKLAELQSLQKSSSESLQKSEKVSLAEDTPISPALEPKKPRKNPPTRRISGVNPIEQRSTDDKVARSSPARSKPADEETFPNTPTIATRRSQRVQEPEKTVIGPQITGGSPSKLKLMPKSVKEKLEEKTTEKIEVNVDDRVVENSTKPPSPARLKLMPKSVREKLEKAKDEVQSDEITKETHLDSPILSPQRGGGPMLTPEHAPFFDIGDNVMITSGTSAGRGASIMKGIPRVSGVEYYLRVFNGPKVKRRESDLRKMDDEETKRVKNMSFVVVPIVDAIIEDSMAKSDRKRKEIKKLDHSGIAGKTANSPLPPRAFSGVENEFKCNEANCDKSFRKQRMLEAHLKHYHKDRISTSPALSLIYSDNSSIVSEPTEEQPEVFDTDDQADSESIETVDTRTQRCSVYQCSCGWEGTEFWSQNPSGVPIRNHICQRPLKARNLKETQMTKEIYRTVDVADYYEGFKLQVYPDQAAQELVREVNKLQNELVERVSKPSQKTRARLRKLRPKIESLKNASAECHSVAPESDAREDDFEFSVAEGVSTAQNAFPDTHRGGNGNGQKANGFTVEELTLLKTVDTTDNEMMEIYAENRENHKILDEIEQYVIHMERDLDQKGL